MKKFRKLIDNFLSSGLKFGPYNPMYNRIRLLNGAALAGVIFLFIFGIINISGEKAVVGIIELIIAIILLFSMAIIRITGKITFTTAILSIVLMLMTMLFVTGGGFAGTAVFWVFSFPGILLFLNGVRGGLIWMIVLFVIIFVLGFLHDVNLITLAYATNIRIVFLISLAFASVFIFVYQKNQEKSYKIMNNQKKELEKSAFALRGAKDSLEKLYEISEKQKSKLNIILQSIGDGVFVLDQDKEIILVNPITTIISGFSENELLGIKYDEKLKFLLEKERTENKGFINKAYETGEISTIQKKTILIRKDGTEVPVGDSASPIKDRSGNTIGCVVVFRDLTHERGIEKMKDEFISLASHQLKTPLAGSKYLLELLFDTDITKLTDEQKEFMQGIDKTNKNMIEMVEDLLNVSRIEAGRKFLINRKPVDLCSIINEVIKEQDPLISKKKINLILPEHSNLCDLFVDPDKIKHVFNNLISNAAKYSNQGGTVELKYEKKGDRLVISVRDEGLGIPKDQQDKIFSKLFRANNAISSEIEGTGLGLYIVKYIIDSHKGKIWFESEEGKGTTFFVELPIKDTSTSENKPKNKVEVS